MELPSADRLQGDSFSTIRTMNLFLELRRHGKLADKRHPMYEKNRFGRLWMYLMAIFWAGYLMFFGTLFAFAMQSEAREPYHIINAGLIFFLVLDFMIRFPFQKTPTQEVKPYLLLPVRRRRVIDFLLLRSGLSGFNLVWLFFFVPFATFTVVRFYGVGGLLGYCLGIWLLMVLNNYWFLLCRTLMNERLAWVLLPLAVSGAVIAAMFVPDKSVLFRWSTDLGECFITGNGLAYLGVLAGIALLCLCVCLACLCAGIIIFTKKDPGKLGYDDREFQELLDENTLLYEQNLRDAYSIPEDTGVKEYLGESYDKELEKENEKYIARRHAVQLLAEQYCGIEPLDYDELYALMESENASRAEKIADGEVVYGNTKFDFPEFCTYYWDGLESSVLDQMMEESDIGSAEIEEYYSSMEEPMYTDGEKVSYYLYTTDGSLPDVKNGERESLELTFGEIRDYIRQYGVEENVFLNFEKNQVNLLYSEAGKNVYIQFAELQKDTDLSDEDQGMIRSRIVEEQYEIELVAVVNKWGL